MNDTDVMNKPELIYYMYEKGFRLNIHHQTATARKNTETVNLTVPEHEEYVTAASSASALSKSLQPGFCSEANI
jgi:hypothetical protein